MTNAANTLNEDTRAMCYEIQAKFPNIPSDSIVTIAKFACLAALAVKTANQTLSANGQELSAKGYEMVFGEVAKIVVEYGK